MPVRLALCALACSAFTLTTAVDAQEGTALPPVVRALHPTLGAAIENGQRRSPTFRRLVNQLAGFDAIVYLVRTPHLPQGIDAGLLHWVGGDRNTRVLRINISTRLDGDNLVATVGHELQHAIEALEDPQVVDGDTMRARFDRIERSQSRIRDSRRPMETDAALDAGRRISGELASAAR